MTIHFITDTHYLTEVKIFDEKGIFMGHVSTIPINGDDIIDQKKCSYVEVVVFLVTEPCSVLKKAKRAACMSSD